MPQPLFARITATLALATGSSEDPFHAKVCTNTLFLAPPPNGDELELIQTQMAQKPMLRAEVYAHAMRASQNRKKDSANAD